MFQPQIKRAKGGGGKLKDPYTGPYIVLKQIAPNNYLLLSEKGSYRLDIVNVERMKKYNRRDPKPIEASDVSLQVTGPEDEDYFKRVAKDATQWVKPLRMPAKRSKGTQSEKLDIPEPQECEEPCTERGNEKEEKVVEKESQPVRRSARLRRPPKRYEEWILQQLYLNQCWDYEF